MCDHQDICLFTNVSFVTEQYIVRFILRASFCEGKQIRRHVKVSALSLNYYVFYFSEHDISYVIVYLQQSLLFTRNEPKVHCLTKRQVVILSDILHNS